MVDLSRGVAMGRGGEGKGICILGQTVKNRQTS